eukprot:5444975-Amphidinium_carterae.3
MQLIRTVPAHIKVHIWFSLPCTGVSPWQRLNRRTEQQRNRLRAMQDLSLKFTVAGIRLATEGLSKGAGIYWEWPRTCSYWSLPLMEQFTHQHNLKTVLVSGCAMNLKWKDEYISKTWCILTNETGLESQPCMKNHSHQQCRGTAARMSGLYTDDFAHWVYTSIMLSSLPCCPSCTTSEIRSTRRDCQTRFHLGRTVNRARCQPDEDLCCEGGILSEKLHTALGRADLPLMYNADRARDVQADPLGFSSNENHITHSRSVEHWPRGFGLLGEGGVCQNFHNHSNPDTCPMDVVESEVQSLSCAALGLVSRTIHPNSTEYASPPVKAAINAEMDKVRKRKVWDDGMVCDLRELRQKEEEVLVGGLMMVTVQKNADQAEDLRKYKGRLVFHGDQMRGTKGTAALSLFEEIAGQPASMNNIRIALSLCAIRKWEATVRDVEQAFLQAPLLRPERSTQCWASLTEDLWIEEWKEKRRKGIMPYADPLWKPCVPLLKALYGHPEAPALWERYLAEQLHARGWVGFESIPGAWLHKKTNSIMMVYVDDLVLVCDPTLTQQLWSDLESGDGGLEFQAPPEQLCRYLGINHTWSFDSSGVHLTADMSAYLDMCLSEYYKESGIQKLSPVTSPFVEESQIADEEWTLPAAISSNQAAAHIMRLFFVARMCRPDLALCITRMASRVTKWSRADDVTLKRLIQFVVYSRDYKLRFDLPCLCDQTVCLRAWPDADLGGATHHSRSTSGLWLELYVPGKTGSWPVAWYGRKRGNGWFHLRGGNFVTQYRLAS